MHSHVAPPRMSLGEETLSDLEAMVIQEQSQQQAAESGEGMTLSPVEPSMIQSSDSYFVIPTVGGEDFKTVLGLDSPDPETISFDLGITRDSEQPIQVVDFGSNFLNAY